MTILTGPLFSIGRKRENANLTENQRTEVLNIG